MINRRTRQARSRWASGWVNGPSKRATKSWVKKMPKFGFLSRLVRLVEKGL